MHLNFQGSMQSLNLQHDKKTVIAIILIIFSVIIVVGMIILLLCIFQESNIISKTFLSIFGNNSKENNEPQYTLLKPKRSLFTHFTYEDETK